jgi:hypothetical protein
VIEPDRFNLVVGWTAMVAGAFSGAAIGLFFHEDGWLGGYASFPRRMLRLGHIAFFGLGMINVLLALSLAATQIPSAYARVASGGFALAAATMPACCFFTAWRRQFRHFFPIPVLAVIAGFAGLFGGWLST